MAEKKPLTQTQDNPEPAPALRWTAAMVLGTGTELLTQCLRDFGGAVRHGRVYFDLHAFFYLGLGILLIIVPLYLISKALEKLITDRGTERIIVILSLVVSAFFMPPLSWFAHLASGLPPLP
jgi:hypothetical protein